MAKRLLSSAEELWEDRLIRQRESGLSITEFCRSESVHPSSFRRWRQRFETIRRFTRRTNQRRTSKKQAFVPVQIAKEAASQSLKSRVVLADPEFSPVCEILVGPVVCRVLHGVDDETLRRLIRVLREEVQ